MYVSVTQRVYEVSVTQRVYEDSVTVVRCGVGMMGRFRMEVGLRQRPALTPFLFK